jgi:carboxypeptidase T
MFIGLLIVPPIQATSSWRTQESDLLLRSVREQRLKDIHDPLPLKTPAGLYHTYDELTVILQNLAMNHSDIMSLSSIGKTYEGRDLWMVKLSDNVNQEEVEPGVLFMGAHHGNEKPSYEVCLFFIQYMVEQYENNSLPEIRSTINSTQIYVIPMVNPDGVEAGTRKNLEPNRGSFGYKTEITSVGVDLNRNYGYRWLRFFLLAPLYIGSTSVFDNNDAYRGQRPFSENETQAIRQFMDTHKITISISYHTYGELILFPWGYTILPAKDKPVFVSIGENISNINDYHYDQSVNLYPTIGDASDWMYGTYGVLAYTIELGKSFAPSDPNVIQEMCVLHTKVNLYVCQRVQSL